MSNREELTALADKALRQGRVDEAIGHYQVLAQMTPVDWGVVKQLADLLERAGQREAAASQFARWADYLFEEGFHSKAAALYKKVLKLDAADEHALWQLAEVSVALKLRADARVAYQRVADMRARRGDTSGASLARERLATLDAGPATAPATGSPRMFPLPEPTPAIVDAAPEPPAAHESEPDDVRAAGEPAPHDAGADVVAAREAAAPETPAERLLRLRADAESADSARDADAWRRWQAVLDADPTDDGVRLRLAQAACDRGDIEAASRLAALLDASTIPVLAVLVEIASRQHRHDTIDRLVAGRLHAGASTEMLIELVDRVVSRDRGAARAAVASAVAAWSRAGRATRAIAVLAHGAAGGWLSTAQHLRWVELCVEDDLASLGTAQCALGRVYLTEGRLAEARAIAEDVVLREPASAVARELFVDVLTAQGVDNPWRVLDDLVAPPAVVERSAPEPVAPPEPLATSVEDVIALAFDDEPAYAPPTPAPEPSPAPVSSSVFDWADLLGRDVPASRLSPPPPDETPAADDVGLLSWLGSQEAPSAPADSFDSAYEFVQDARENEMVEEDDEVHEAHEDHEDHEADEPEILTAVDEPQEDEEEVEAAEAVEDTSWIDVVPVEPTGDSAMAEVVTIDEEIDLTDLLDQLKQWDPALPEPLRPVRDSAPEPASSEPEPAMELSPESGSELEPEPVPAVDPEPVVGMTHMVAPLGDWTGADEPGIEELPVDLAPPPADEGRTELDAVFADLQQRHGDDRTVAEQQLAAGRVFLAAGLASEAARAFERASAEPRMCFEAAHVLAQLHRSRGQLVEAVAWYERAAEAPVPDAAVKHSVLYDLAESLESLGESERALGVLLDLLSQVEDYRDARPRLDRLLRVDAGG